MIRHANLRFWQGDLIGWTPQRRTYSARSGPDSADGGAVELLILFGVHGVRAHVHSV
ncbi:hypothetical protein LCL87_16325 [Rhodococcus hoagii]|nr:hypothetical protein [Prescottella equi]